MDLWFIIRSALFVFLLVLLIALVYILIIAKIVRKYYKFPIPGFLTRVIDNPIRRRFVQKPKVIATRMQLKPGMRVVEIGPGKGNYTKAVAEKILPDGKVYAIDIQESVIDRLSKKVEKEKISNIIPMIDDAYNLSFEDESINRIFLIACLPEIPDPVKALREFKRVLKPDGIISLCEMFLDPDYPRRKTEKKWAEQAGLKFIQGFGNWFVYQLNFGKK